ncbi:uncharacterized protein [Hemitrygon akajei]|uniref:uncharacterized protein isoform X2 n=1 Tax=Hemitrygon akajei TaxID=2704970 RepID=UPI003BF9B0C8
MSDAYEIVHALKEDTFKSETSEDPTNDGKEIASKDSCDLQHQDNSKNIPGETLEIQLQNDFINRQDKVEAISGQDRTQTSGQHEDESDTAKAQTEANNGISDKAMDDIDRLHIQESTDVDEPQPPSNSGVKDVSQSEMVQIQIQASDDGQGEVWSEMQQVQQQIVGNEQGKALSTSTNFECQSISAEHTEVLGKSGQVEGQPDNGQKDEVLFELGQVEDKSDNYGQGKGHSDLEKTEEQSTRRQNKTLCELDRAENHPINGHSEAQSEQNLVQDQGDLGGQGGDSCESGQINDDEKDDTTSGTSSDQPKTLDGRKLTNATCTIKLLSTGKRTFLFTGKRFPTYSRKMGKFKMERSFKSIENVNLNAPGAEKIESEPDEKSRFSAESILTNGTQDSAVGMMNVDDKQNKDKISAKKNVTQCRKGGKVVRKFWCDLCKLACRSALNLQAHFLGLKHKKIEAALKWYVNKVEGFTKDVYLVPMEMRSVEDHLNELKINKAVIGLEYVVEYRYGQKKNPKIFCKLCNFKSEIALFLLHILGSKHMETYLCKHYPSSLNVRKAGTVSKWKVHVNKKALQIERKYGRGQVTIVEEKIDTKANEKSAVKRRARQSIVEPEYKRQKCKATPAGTADDLLSSIGSKILEDHIKKSNFKEAIIGLDYLTQCHYKGKTEPLYYCELCHYELPLECILAHISGFKHTKMYIRRRHPDSSFSKHIVKYEAAEIEKTNGRGRVKVIRDYDGSPLSEKTTASKDAATADDLRCSIGSKILEDHIKKSNFMEALIGLDFLTEYHYKEQFKPMYYCELCHYELTLKPMLAHISGYKHMKMYMRRRHPNSSFSKHIVKYEAAEIEKTNGRGRVKVIRDYDTCPPSERTAEAIDESQLQDMEYCSFDQDQRNCVETSCSSSRTDRNQYASSSSKPGRGVTSSKESQLQDMEYCNFDQDQRTCVETSCSSRCTDRNLYASTSSKPRSRVTSSKVESWTDPKYSRSESSTSKRNQTRKRENSKEIKHPGEDWRDECKRSIKRSKLMEDKMEREESKHFDRDVDQRQERIWNSRDDLKQRVKSRKYRDDHKQFDTSYLATKKYVQSRPEDITKKDVLGFLANFKVINDTDARQVKRIMYKLSNQLLQFGKRALQLTRSTEKLIEAENPILADERRRYESRRAGILRDFPGHPAVQNATTSMSSIQNHLLTPSLLNSIRGMDVNTITNTLTRLAANNPAFEGIRISTLVTVLMEAGVLGKRPN